MSTQKALAGLYSLDHNVKLYIPSTDHVSEHTDNSRYIREALELFSTLFGGATSYDAMGSWVSNERGLVVEAVKIVESYATKEQVTAGIAKVIAYAEKIKHEMNQEAVSLEYDNKLYFI